MQSYGNWYQVKLKHLCWVLRRMDHREEAEWVPGSKLSEDRILLKSSFARGIGGGYQPDPDEDGDGTSVPGKLLEIVDNAGSTGLGGFYIRIPVSASKAFGEIIRTFSTFAVVWFANCITWSGTDNFDTAFLYHVTLDELIRGEGSHTVVVDLDSTRLQFYKEQVYFIFLPTFMNIWFQRKTLAVSRYPLRTNS